jgi:acetoin utilization protein AcuB
MLTASKLLKEKGIRHLPVLDGQDRLVGVITDRDIKRASASEATALDIHELLYLLDRLEVAKVMTKNPIAVSPDTSVREAAQLMVRHKIGCLPVAIGGKLVGIVTEIDMLKLLARGEG